MSFTIKHKTIHNLRQRVCLQQTSCNYTRSRERAQVVGKRQLILPVRLNGEKAAFKHLWIIRVQCSIQTTQNITRLLGALDRKSVV